MKTFPEVSIARFEQLQPGDLFIYLNSRGNSVAIKTQRPSNGDRELIAVLGPSFPDGTEAPMLINWEAATTVSFGNYTVFLPTDSSSWSDVPPPADILCLARSEDKLYLRINGSVRLGQFFACFVELATGLLIEGNLKGTTAYALSWEFVVVDGAGTPRSILKFPYNKEAA